MGITRGNIQLDQNLLKQIYNKELVTPPTLWRLPVRVVVIGWILLWAFYLGISAPRSNIHPTSILSGWTLMVMNNLDDDNIYNVFNVCNFYNVYNVYNDHNVYKIFTMFDFQKEIPIGLHLPRHRESWSLNTLVTG